MTKVFILILVVWGHKAGGPTTAEFNSFEACNAAGQAAVSTLLDGWGNSADFICVEKGVISQ